MLGEEVGLHAAGGLIHGQAAQDRLERVGQLAVGVAEQGFEAGRQPVEAGTKIEVEQARPAAVAQLREPFVGAEAGLLELLAVADVEVCAHDALQRAVGPIVLDADAVNPHIVAEGVLHPELVRKWPHSGRAGPALAVGSGGGIVGVDEVEPGLVGVGKRGLGIAQQLLPRGRVVDLVLEEVQVEEAQRAAFVELGEEAVRGGGRGGGRNRAAGRTDEREVACGLVAAFLEPHRHLERGRFLGLEAQRDRVVGGSGKQDLPLRLHPARLP